MQQHVFKWYRYLIGYVFISTGMMKLLVPNFIAVFESLGIPFPHITVFIVAIVEVTCGALIIGRMYVKHASLALIVVMIGALSIAKFPIFLHDGLLAFLFESRLDVVMLVLLIFLWRHCEIFALKK